eukprot:scaffold41538_cov45-Phaeocystis_antarctica.AAC.1
MGEGSSCECFIIIPVACVRVRARARVGAKVRVGARARADRWLGLGLGLGFIIIPGACDFAPFCSGVSESTYAEKGDWPRPCCTCCKVLDQSEDSGPVTGAGVNAGGGGKHERIMSGAGVAVDAGAGGGGSSGDPAEPVRGQGKAKLSEPLHRTAAPPPHHTTAPSHRRCKACVRVPGKSKQTCSVVARGSYAEGEAGARAAAVLQMGAIQAHAFGRVLLIVHSEPPLAQRKAARHLRAAAARRRGRPLEGRRLQRVGRRRVVWSRCVVFSLGRRVAIHFVSTTGVLDRSFAGVFNWAPTLNGNPMPQTPLIPLQECLGG